MCAGGKKTTNFDACRDLDGRRIRHSRMTERIQEFEERQREDDELVLMPLSIQ